MGMTGECSVCGRAGTIRRGLCDAHYQQARAGTIVAGNEDRAPVSAETRAKISASLTGRAGPAGKDHPMYGKTHSEETRAKMSAAKAGIKRGPQPARYADGPASYQAVHMWMRRHHPMTGTCEACSETRKTFWSNISGEYRRDRDDFWELCVPCHKLFDYILRIERADPAVVAVLRAKREP